MTKQSILNQKNVDCHEAKASRNDGFTLAEVLITLVIIGVIAALTVPNLIIKHQKEETVTKLKKVYSTISQAYVKMQTDLGTNFTFDIDYSDNNQREDAFKESFLKYIRINKYCSREQFNNCFADISYNLNKSVLWNTTGGFSKDYIYGFALDDGICVMSWLGIDHIQFYADLNCKKGPNRMGRDIFQMTLMLKKNEDEFIDKLGLRFPRYQDNGDFNMSINRNQLLDESSAFNCNKNKKGNNCGAIIQMDGWQIKDDYPW